MGNVLTLFFLSQFHSCTGCAYCTKYSSCKKENLKKIISNGFFDRRFVANPHSRKNSTYLPTHVKVGYLSESIHFIVGLVQDSDTLHSLKSSCLEY